MFSYHGYKAGGSFDFELYLSIDSMNAFGNKRVQGFFVIKNFNFDIRMINSNLKVINQDQL